jgi:hypothetical protein
MLSFDKPLRCEEKKLENLILHIALANTYNCDFQPDEIYNYLENDQNIIHGYQFAPKGTAASAIDYLAVLYVVGSTASVASLLWNAYDKYIGSKKRDKKDSAGLFISLDVSAGTRFSFWIGKDYVDKKIFIQIFSKKLAEFQKTKRAQDIYEKTIEEIKSSDDWVRRK